MKWGEQEATAWFLLCRLSWTIYLTWQSAPWKTLSMDMECGFRNVYLLFGWDYSMNFVLGDSNCCSSFILHLKEEPPVRVVMSPIFHMPVYAGYVSQKKPKVESGSLCNPLPQLSWRTQQTSPVCWRET